MVEIMLGDTLPWFFPVLALVLCLWLMIGSIEKKTTGEAGAASGFVPMLVHWTPPVMFAGLFLHRCTAIMTSDQSHVEVLQFLPDGPSVVERLTLLFAGQGGLEFAALSAAVFAVSSHRLPSVRAMGDHAATAVRQRIMMFCSLCLLLSAGVFFPEQAYTASNPLPMDTVGMIPPLSAVLLPVFFALMVMFGGELFAASSVYNIDADFSILAKKATIKCVLLACLCLAWLSTEPQIWSDWKSDPTTPTHLVALLMMVHATVVLSAVLQPSRRIEARLVHGEARSVALLVNVGVIAVLMLLSTALLLRKETALSSGGGATLYALWLCTAVLGAMLLVQFMPTFGFDAAPRPETWWIRAMGLVIPMIVMAMTPLGVYLIPAVWLALAWSIVVPWMIESDVQSPSMGFVVLPLGAATCVALGLPMLATHAFLAGLLASLPALLIAVLGMLVHKPSATPSPSENRP